ncbi:MAG TPA: DUF1634 domain-containing protein [Gemmatimonadales bacterium]|nr:DUF1634 domain-containing protein [Gemmatimonadales bacterium]
MAPRIGSEPGGGPAAGRRWSDRDVEQLLGRLLRTGVAVAAAVVLAGGVVYLLGHHAGRPSYGTFAGEPEDLTRVGGIVRGAGRMSGRALIQLGLLLLIATPVARVGFSLAAFLRERDWPYVLLTGFVLALLLLSLIGQV